VKPGRLVGEDLAVMADDLDLDAAIVIFLANAPTSTPIGHLVCPEALLVLGFAALAVTHPAARRLLGLKVLSGDRHRHFLYVRSVPSRRTACP